MSLPMLILFGSETGNAEDVAETIGREARRRGLTPRVMSMDAFPVQNIPEERLVIFLAATTGQGEVPKNMRTFWKFLLRKTLPADSLKGVCTAVFGLGDSGYQKYNVTGKKLANRLAGLGCDMLIERGLGDDQHPSGYEAGFDPWSEKLWKALELRFGVEKAFKEDGIGLPKYCVRFLDGESGDASRGGGGAQIGRTNLEKAVEAAASFRQIMGEASGSTFDSTWTSEEGVAGRWKPHMAKVLKNERITTAEHFQDVRHIELDIHGSGLNYRPGDVLTIFPQTPENAVEEFLKRMGLNGEDWIEVSANQGPVDVSTRSKATMRIRELVAGVLDVCGASPRRFFFKVLHAFAQTEVEIDRLAYFASTEGRDDLHVYNQREGRTVLEVLQDFPSATPPLEWLLQACPIKQPRQFSISSSPAAHIGEAHVTVAIVKWRTPFKRQRFGLCTSWLANISPGGADRIPVWVESGALSLPKEASTPMILIGPGTGVAPFRSFLEERQQILKSNPANPPAPSLLFFGCRNEQGDFYYRTQWEALQESGVLDKNHGLVAAFSRDQPKKVYVTDKLREMQGVVREWVLEKGASVYVAGSAKKMPSNVMEAFQEILVGEDVSAENAKKLLRTMELKGRYFVEAWS
ncbi:hypothetical protein BSKO_09043 [Bryopsis sp. KO-2023]|nr:hypothetical protein BSKO_09043 [Bryopsis sp. KO-2023]